MEIRKTNFDYGNGTTFKGYTKGNLWNGFDCPLFEVEECEKIVELFNSENEEFGTEVKLVYDSTKDCYVEIDPNIDEEDYISYEFTSIDTKDGIKRVCSLGSFNWCWEEV